MTSKKLGIRRRIALNIFSKLYHDVVAEHKLHTLFWECTLRCNLACRHCGSDCRVDAAIKDMPLADFLKVIDEQVSPNVNPSDLLVILSGGEVLVRDDLEIAGHELAKRGYSWGMVTNGLALNRSKLDSLMEAGLRSISVSLDGFEQQHTYIRVNPRSYERAIEAIKMLAKESTLAFDVVTCATTDLIGRLAEFRDLLLSLGVRHWRIFSIFPSGRARQNESLELADEDFRTLLEFIRATRREGKIDLSYACEGFLGGYEGEVRDNFYQCAAGVSVASIRVDGAISGCTSIRANYHQGNIYQDNFWEVWQNRFSKFRDRKWAKCGQCADCKQFRYCMGGGMHLRDDRGELAYCHYKKL